MSFKPLMKIDKNNCEKEWSHTLHEFLKKWKGRKNVIGALVTRSYIFGTHNKYSDIDIHIVLADDAQWRERGNCIIQGYLIEYFVNSSAQLKQYRINDLKNHTRIDARMFALGRIVFDKTGELRKLQKECRKELELKFKKLSRVEIELGKYSIRDELENLKDLWERKSAFYRFSHNLLLQRALEVYRKFLGIEVSASAKLERYFKEPTFRKNYAIEKFPDVRFVKLFIAAVENQNFSSLTALVDHVLKAMGGFDINGWKLRSKTSVS